MFQPELEAQPAEQRAALQATRLRDLAARLGHEPDAQLEELPFTTKAELRDAYPFGSLAVPLEQTVRDPRVVRHARQADDRRVHGARRRASSRRSTRARSRARAAGARTSLHVAYGYGLFTGGLGLHYGGERLGATVVPASGGNAALQVSLMADLGATGLCCTPSFALLLAERAEADGLLGRIRLRYGVFGAEPWSEAIREKLEAAWGGSTRATSTGCPR